MLRAMLFGLLLLLQACALSVPVYVGESEPEPLVMATASAVDRWNELLGLELLELRVLARASAGHADLFSIVVESCDVVRNGHNAYTLALGAANHVSVRRGALGELDAATLEWLLAHEFGHVFGLQHEGAGNLMYDDPEWGAESYELTAKQKRRARAVAGLEAAL